jgi:hypothetical protein
MSPLVRSHQLRFQALGCVSEILNWAGRFHQAAAQLQSIGFYSASLLSCDRTVHFPDKFATCIEAVFLALAERRKLDRSGALLSF